jgi:hypothetical protein
VPSSYYEIRVTSVLPPEVLLDFDRLIASVEPVETVVHGPLRDQADLNGLLARLETFGVQVLEVRRLQDRDPPQPSVNLGVDVAGWSGRGPGCADEPLDVLAERPVLLDRIDEAG